MPTCPGYSIWLLLYFYSMTRKCSNEKEVRGDATDAALGAQTPQRRPRPVAGRASGKFSQSTTRRAEVRYFAIRGSDILCSFSFLVSEYAVAFTLVPQCSLYCATRIPICYSHRIPTSQAWIRFSPVWPTGRNGSGNEPTKAKYAWFCTRFMRSRNNLTYVHPRNPFFKF